jgi:hypothetical protein
MPQANGPEKRSGLDCKAERRWSGISGGYDVELRPFGVLSLQSIPRVQNPTISVRAGEGILARSRLQGLLLFHRPIKRNIITTRGTTSTITSILVYPPV